MTIDKQALREAAMGNIKYAQMFIKPSDILELLDEVEAMKRANAAQDDHINQQQDRIDQLEKGHSEAARKINSWRRLAKQNIAERDKDLSELDMARKRIAELERSETQLIGERDDAEFALADMYEAGTGERPEWSNAFGFCDAVDEVRENVDSWISRAEAAEKRIEAEISRANREHHRGFMMACKHLEEHANVHYADAAEIEIAALRQRIAELEALAKSVKFDPIPMEELGNKSDGKKHPYMFGAGYNSAVVHCESVMLQSFAAAGIGKGEK